MHQLSCCFFFMVHWRVLLVLTAPLCFIKDITIFLFLQHEKAFQKQSNVFLASKKLRAAKKGRRGNRWTKNVGLGFVTPKEAIEGTYIDKKCPFTGDVSIRGRILKGIVVSTKMKRTIVVRRHYLHYRPKYNRYEKRHRNISAHCSPCFDVKEGDIVTIGQCRLV